MKNRLCDGCGRPLVSEVRKGKQYYKSWLVWKCTNPKCLVCVVGMEVWSNFIEMKKKEETNN